MTFFCHFNTEDLINKIIYVISSYKKKQKTKNKIIYVSFDLYMC